MKLFYRSYYHSPEYVEARKKAIEVHNNSPMKNTHGASGLFFTPDDIYLYGKLEKWVEDDPRIGEELRTFIDRYKREDYGFVSRAEAENNLENKWIGGYSSWTIARYQFEDKDLATWKGGIILEFLKNEGYLYSMDDNIDELRAAVKEL